METCKFGADDQKLEGAKRNAFIKKCMAKGNFEPPGRKVAKKPAPKKPAQEAGRHEAAPPRCHQRAPAAEAVGAANG